MHPVKPQRCIALSTQYFGSCSRITTPYSCLRYCTHIPTVMLTHVRCYAPSEVQETTVPTHSRHPFLLPPLCRPKDGRIAVCRVPGDPNSYKAELIGVLLGSHFSGVGETICLDCQGHCICAERALPDPTGAMGTESARIHPG